jgi:hypothetical protein
LCLLTCFFVSNFFWRWFFLVTLSQQYIWHNMFFWSHTLSSRYVPYNKSLCFEGVLFRHMINMFSWSHYPSNISPYINPLCFEGVLFRHTILAIYTTHNSTFHTHMPYSSKLESKDGFVMGIGTHPNLSLKMCLTGIGTHPNLSLKMCLMGIGTHPNLSIKMCLMGITYTNGSLVVIRAVF